MPGAYGTFVVPEIPYAPADMDDPEHCPCRTCVLSRLYDTARLAGDEEAKRKILEAILQQEVVDG